MKIFLQKNLNKIIFIISTLSLFVSFYFNEDGSGSGASGDFVVTYGFILALQENLLSDPKDWTLVHTPLHFIILSFVTRLVSNTDLLRFLFCVFSISLPLLFYKTILVSKSINFFKANLLILSSAILFIPSFRYTSIWANDLITSLFFFILSIYYFKKWEINKSKDLEKNSLLQILFLVLATYTRQYFAVFFIYFLFNYYLYFSKSSFVKLFLICVLSSIPVFYYTYLFPELLTGQNISFDAINYFLIGNSSIISLTIIPIIFINIIYKTINLKKLIVPSFLGLLIVFILSLNFDPFSSWKGGGVNHLISKKIFNNNFYLYVTAFITITTFIFLSLEKKENILILFIVLFMFFSSQVYQRYYDPMFFLIFFTLVKTHLTQIFLVKTNAVLLLFVYFVIYYFFSVTDLIYNI